MEAIQPKITNIGLQRLLNLTNDGLEGVISHIAFGDGNGAGYAPTGGETKLVRERARVPIIGGERVAPTEIQLQALLDEGPSFWIREAGFFLDDGTLFAVWSDPTTPLAYKTAGIPLAIAYYLALAGIPPNSVNISITGPNLSLFFDGDFARLSTAIIGNKRRTVELDERLVVLERDVTNQLPTHVMLIQQLQTRGDAADLRGDELLGLSAQLGARTAANSLQILANDDRTTAIERLVSAQLPTHVMLIQQLQTRGDAADLRGDELLGLSAQLGARTAANSLRILANDDRTAAIERLVGTQLPTHATLIQQLAARFEGLNSRQMASRDVWSQSVAGTYTFVVPTDVNKIFCRVCGGGGGAGGIGVCPDGTPVPGGGGGAGGYAEGWIDVIPGQSITVIVGAGGAGGAPSNGVAPSGGYNGGSGGTTSVGPWVSATGGGGGGGGASGSVAGAAGGMGVGGSITLKGGFGSDGPLYGSNIFGGHGGASAFGGGGRAATAHYSVVMDGQAPGSGAGATYGAWRAIGPGGRGADGIAIIQW